MAKKASGPQQITLEIPYRERVSRLFIFRFLWIFPLMPIFFIWGMWISIVFFLQFFHMLLLGKKSAWLWHQLALIFVYSTRWNAYFNVLVDEAPGLLDFDLLK